MNFSFSEDQLAIQDLVEKMMADRVTDEFWRDFAGSDAPYDAELWSLLAESGMLGMALPESCGGSEMGMIELCLLLQAQGRFLAPVPLLSTLVAGALPIAWFGTEIQQQAYLPRVVSGDAVLTAALSEVGKTNEAIAFEAQPKGDGLILSGASDAVPYAEQAAAILVPARLDGSVVLLIVDPNQAGVTLQSQQTTNGEPVARLVIEELTLSSDALLGQRDESWRWLEQHVLTAAAAIQLGVAQEALRRTAEYTTERQQFGLALSGFQSVAHRAANAYIDVETMRSTLWQAAWRLSANLPAETEVRTAKWWASEGGHRVAHSAQHLHGGIGSDIDYPIHRYFLWAKQLEFVGGGVRSQLATLGAELATATTLATIAKEVA